MQYKSVLNGCIARMYSCAYGTFTAKAENSPLCEWQHGIRQPTLDLQIALSASSKNTRCATSDVNPFKIRCNLQITKVTVNETQ